MERNVGGTDKTARIVLGVAFGVASMAAVAWGEGIGTTNQIAIAAVALLVAIVLLATASAETCPINAAVGRDTCRGGRLKPAPVDRDGRYERRPGRAWTSEPNSGRSDTRRRE